MTLLLRGSSNADMGLQLGEELTPSPVAFFSSWGDVQCRIFHFIPLQTHATQRRGFAGGDLMEVRDFVTAWQVWRPWIECGSVLIGDEVLEGRFTIPETGTS